MKNNITKKSFIGVVFLITIGVLIVDFSTVLGAILNIFDNGDFLEKVMRLVFENEVSKIMIFVIILLALIESLILIFSHKKESNNLYKINFYIFSLYIFAILMYFAIWFFMFLIFP